MEFFHYLPRNSLYIDVNWRSGACIGYNKCGNTTICTKWDMIRDIALDHQVLAGEAQLHDLEQCSCTESGESSTWTKTIPPALECQPVSSFSCFHMPGWKPAACSGGFRNTRKHYVPCENTPALICMQSWSYGWINPVIRSGR